MEDASERSGGACDVLTDSRSVGLDAAECRALFVPVRGLLPDRCPSDDRIWRQVENHNQARGTTMYGNGSRLRMLIATSLLATSAALVLVGEAGAWSLEEAAAPYKGTTIRTITDQVRAARAAMTPIMRMIIIMRMVINTRRATRLGC